jgi:methylenetetrahydrofolate reductase (NADPH)
VNQIMDMNRGGYLDDDIGKATPTAFCIGVAGYPEKHFEAPNLVNDMKNLKAKVDAGAEYIVTQLFYDNQKFFDFVKRCRDMDITVPIIPGLKPITMKKQLLTLPKLFHIDIPVDLAEAIDKATSDEQVKQIGIEWAVQQSRELMNADVPCLHFYTMGKSEAVRKIAQQIF